MLPRIGRPVSGSIGIRAAVSAARHISVVANVVIAVDSRVPHDRD